ncbi:MAG: LLM class F420-dependent oxidoreductase [Chloroflexi bacterium]|nr:LLM class F420-dependent oxidoreductase [Chloroflexota bacterium]
MDLGISTFLTDYSIDVAVLAAKIEELGFDSLWMPEHVFVPAKTESPWPGSPDGVIPRVYADIVDPFVALARASAVTSKIKLATGICLVPERNPLLLAKEVATLDMYSGGRFLFGIGAGWLKEETEIMGGNFSRRWTQTRESILAMKELWTKTESEHHGEFYDFPALYSFPTPAQRPHPPVLLGGMAKNVFKRVVEWGDGWMPNRVEPEDVAKGRAALDELADAAGRDPSSLEITVYGKPPDRELLKRFEEAGANRVTIRLETLPESEALDELNKIAESVL